MIPKSGPVFQVLDKVACGLEKLSTTRLVSHRMVRTSSPAKTCGCSHCQPHATVVNETIIQHGDHLDSMQFDPSISHGHQSDSPLTNPSAVLTPGGPKTTIRRDTPMPIPRPAPLQDEHRPGRTFDRLTDPFQDDSASRTASREPSIRRTTFATASTSMTPNDDQSRSDRTVGKTDVDLNRSEADEFDDYFRVD
ncbi:hypothetical protein [Neorhodopirellula pilleata]|uniref:hypothetical protein n=1 Tax=Neorhodopirellula pilleata TaxID=2714738 RepID=UPI0011B82E8D|nr:hypothetical protein [Neorhodopirellula pilleata]